MSAHASLRRWLGRGAVASAGLAILGLVGWRAAIGWTPADDRYPTQGVDVSQAAGSVDWPMVKAGGADFAYIEATAGARQRDPQFATNWGGALAAGLRRGALHRYAFCEPAREQANAFIVTVPRVADALPAALALDDDAGCPSPPDRATLIAGIASFARLVEKHTGKPILVRITPAIERRYQLSAALDRPLWLTGDFLKPDYAARPWRIWRANALRRVDGVDGPVGWDVVAP